LTYNLGFKDDSNKKAEKGNVVHKALELLANKKLCLQNGTPSFFDNELKQEFSAIEISPESSIIAAYNHYANKSIHAWEEKDLKDCEKWTWDTLLFNNGMFSPLSRKIEKPEQYFDIEIKFPWAKYEYYIDDGTILSGNLRIKGTMDLIARVDKKTIEYIDWKTGERKNWATGKEKSYDDFYKDFQLRLYHYALSELYPDEENIIITIFFNKSGGPFTLCFHKEDVAKTVEMIRHEFEKIKSCHFPTRIIDYGKDRWKCERLCRFHKEKHEDSDLSICEFMNKEIIQLGMSRAYLKHANKGTVSSYGDGGGQSNRENKDV
jgi:hypothetical protein